VLGGTGVDVVLADTGNDTVYAGHGNDRVSGGPAPDSLLGQSGNDRLIGGDGSDRIYGGAGIDRLEGGPGEDQLMASAESTAIAGEDNVKIYLHDEGAAAGPVGDAVRYGAYAGAGNDAVDARDGRPSRVDCGPGTDRLYTDPGDRATGERRTESRRG
jgi:Ca2+-binding RTX toxin-like protein